MIKNGFMLKLIISLLPLFFLTISYNLFDPIDKSIRSKGKNSEAIFGTLGGMPQCHFYEPSTISKDSISLYHFLPNNIGGGMVAKGLSNNIQFVKVGGNGSTLKTKIVGIISWSNMLGLVYINVSSSVLDT